MGYTKRNCDNCNKEYMADNRNLKRGWGLCCSKSCAAKKREKSRPDYDPETVKYNNLKRAGLLPREGSFRKYTSEGYRIINGTAYDEFDNPVYDVDPYEDAYNHGQWE